MMKNYVTILLLLLSLDMFTIQAQPPDHLLDSRNDLSKQFSKLVTRNISIPVLYRRRLAKLKDQQTQYLNDYPQDLVIRWNRAEVSLILGETERAVHDFVAVVDYASEEEKAWFANNFAMILAELVSSGQIGFMDECCKLNRLRVLDGIWQQTCRPDASIEAICGCKD